MITRPATRIDGEGRSLLSSRIAELDGLRGLAALAVVVAHYFGEVPHGFRIFTVGWLGVDVFFVLSGFLIGSIILTHRESPGFFLSFYARRAARILPIYFLTIFAVFASLALVGAGATWADAPLPLAAYLTFTQNFAMLIGGETQNLWLTPTWTLAVEEQFYVLAPLVLVMLPRRHILPFLIACIALAVIFRAGLLLAGGHWMASLVLLPSRLDLFACGIVGAHLVNAGALADGRRDGILRAVPLLAALLLLAIMVMDARAQSQWFKVLTPLVLGVGAASFILALVRGAPEGRRFRAKTLGFLGTVSYGLYLIHQPVAGLLHGLLLGGRPDIGTGAELAVTMLAFAASIALAWMSWRLLEAPLIRIGRRWAYAPAREARASYQPA